MLSDESSSDSETGRFKSSQSRKTDDQNKSSDLRDSHRRDGGRSRAFNERPRLAERPRDNDRFRPSEGDRMRRDLDRRRNDRDRYERRSKDRQRPPRHSPVRRRQSRERSPARRRRSQDEDKSKRPQEDRSSRDTRDRKDPSGHSRVRSSSRDHKRRSTSRISSEKKKEEPVFKDDPKPSAGKYDRSRKRDSSSSPDYKSKRSVVQKPTYVEPPKRVVESPVDVDQHAASDVSDEVQPGSYYSLKPVVVAKEKEKSVEKDTSKETIISDESSEIDSSDDERLRAKLLNLEKELSKTRKKKHKKKHKKRSKSEKDRDKSASVEVTSTTDIQEVRGGDGGKDTEVEVTSTQKSKEKESSEEGELSSDGSQSVEIDEDDLRHKLKRAPRGAGVGVCGPRGAGEGVCGPALPPHLRRGDGVEGPALPPHLNKDKSKSMGPTIPSEMRKVLAEAKPEDIEYASSEEDAGFGPLPPGAEGKWTEAHERLERRAMDMKMKAQDGHSLQGKEVKGREKWMLELPEGKAKIIGLEARSFRAKEGPDMSDRSSWTDTPSEKARKAAGLAAPEDVAESLQREARERRVAERDEAQEREARKHKKKHKRDESLLEMHEKKLKKKKKKEEREDGKQERRPFSRDVDLAVNRFDEAQKKSIIKKAQALDTRFSRGDAKYL